MHTKGISVSLNELYFRQSQKNGLRGCNFSRWAGWGDHRHPVQFSGDAHISWPMLEFEIKLSSYGCGDGCYTKTTLRYVQQGSKARVEITEDGGTYDGKPSSRNYNPNCATLASNSSLLQRAAFLNFAL